MQIIALAVVLQLFMLLANQVFNHSDAISPTKVFYKKGDHPGWAEVALKDDDWSDTQPESNGIYWIRAEFDLSNHRFPDRKKELVISVLGAYEVYFEGVFIGKNGQLSSNASEETPGYLDQKFILPEFSSKNGKRVLALRISNHLGNPAKHQISLSIDSYNEFYKYGIVLSLLLYTLAGMFLTVALYYSFLFFVSRRRIGYLLFGVFCLVLFALIIQTYSRYYWPYLYPQYSSWLMISGMLSLLAAILLPIFIIDNFQPPWKNWIIAVSTLVVVVSYLKFSFDESTPLFFSVTISTFLTIWAIFKKRSGSWEALTGLLIFLTGMMYFDQSIFVGFGILVMANLFSLAVIQKKERGDYEASLLRSSRLKLELLKKNLKPHFLMNSLTNIISLIENEPKTSIRLIEALSEEFYSLNEMTDKKLVSLHQELKLCDSHLEVMGIRNDITYEFSKEVDSMNIMLPPATLHTLVENGITHCRPLDGKVKFDLLIKENKAITFIQMKVKGILKKGKAPKAGTGISYLRSRLEESFPGQWKLEYGKLDEHTWYTNIEF